MNPRNYGMLNACCSASTSSSSLWVAAKKIPWLCQFTTTKTCAAHQKCTTTIICRCILSVLSVVFFHKKRKKMGWHFDGQRGGRGTDCIKQKWEPELYKVTKRDMAQQSYLQKSPWKWNSHQQYWQPQRTCSRSSITGERPLAFWHLWRKQELQVRRENKREARETARRQKFGDVQQHSKEPEKKALSKKAASHTRQAKPRGKWRHRIFCGNGQLELSLSSPWCA